MIKEFLPFIAFGNNISSCASSLASHINLELTHEVWQHVGSVEAQTLDFFVCTLRTYLFIFILICFLLMRKLQNFPYWGAAREKSEKLNESLSFIDNISCTHVHRPYSDSFPLLFLYTHRCFWKSKAFLSYSVSHSSLSFLFVSDETQMPIVEWIFSKRVATTI